MFSLIKQSGRIHFIIKTHVIRFLHSKSAGGKEDLVEAGEIPIPKGVWADGRLQDPEELFRIVGSLVEEREWKKKQLYFTVPDHSVVIRMLDIPAEVKEEEIKGYLYMQVGDTLHLPFDNPSFDFAMIREDEDGKKTIVIFAYPEIQMEEMSRLFERTGLKPVVADISALAIHRAYLQSMSNEEGEHLLLADWNIDGCVLTVFRDGAPVVHNHTTCPLSFEQWEKTNGCYSWSGEDPAEPSRHTMDQVNEIERVMAFYRYSVMNDEAGVSKVMITGDWPDKDRAVDLLTERNVKAERWCGDEAYPGVEADVLGLSWRQ
ncbi:type IV pilus biogenesis protein PilM [Halobacillus sp. KGW1]|uniref:type IV pilus biogenesis protein PilM n=1 Tax=Halobacillus sp. KGW1 TaxID=1793726 RepID=UPI0007855290|nr:pilus assembly protein PilM [Halobacillus sp. KGW1]